ECVNGDEPWRVTIRRLRATVVICTAMRKIRSKGISLKRMLVAILFQGSLLLQAHEGMWLPTLLKGIESDMRTAGMLITAEDIYSINQGSIKDAVVLFGGGCTAEVI